MNRKEVSGIVLTLLLIGVLTLTSKVQQVKAEPRTWALDDDGPVSSHTMHDATNAANSEGTDSESTKPWSMKVKSDVDIGLGAEWKDVLERPFTAFPRWDFDKVEEWRNFACVDDDSTELVIGLKDIHQNNYSELVDLIASKGGKFVNTVSIDGKISAVVADIPHVTVSPFVAEVEIAGLSRYIEPNLEFKLDFVPDDSDWPKQWGPRIIEADYAWNTTMGDPSVLVAVIDTGIDWDHPDLAANYVPLGYDWVNNDTDPMDDHGHGTHCAGIIGGVINNSIGVAGLAQVRIMAEKGLGPSGGWADDLAKAIVHAVDQGADILSNSWGSVGGEMSALIYEAVKYAYDHGALVIAAAGNDITECKHYPAAHEEVIAVTATDKTDTPAYFTNFGDWVELSAPGVNIYSTVWNDSYDSKSGTSMACPHIAGVAALIWSQFPDMTRDQVRAQLRDTADDLGDPGFDEYYGYGRVNARRAVEQPLPDHDLTLLYWKMPSIVKPFSMVTINGTLVNFGVNNESDVAVRLLVNGSVAESVLVSQLADGVSTTIGFAWSPVIEGKYNVTLYVEPVHGELSTENNILFGYVIVRLSEVFTVPNDFTTVQKAINAVSPGYTISVEPGIYYEHIIVAKSVTLIGENRQTTIIDGQRKGRVVWVHASNSNVTGFTIQNGGYGIFVLDSHNTNITGSTIIDNSVGTLLAISSDNTFRDNNMTSNYSNLHVTGYNLSHYIHDIDTSNTVDGKPVYYWVNRRDVAVPLGAGYVALVNCTRITVQNLNLTNNGQGVLLAYTTHSTITKNNITNNVDGIVLYESSNCNTVSGNNITNNEYGIDLWNSDNNIIIKNVITHCFDGIILGLCNNNTIRGNHVVLIRYKGLPGRWGIFLVASFNNTIFDNEITENHTGLYLALSSYNKIANNTIANNGIGNLYHFSNNNTVIANLITENLVGIRLLVSSDNVIHHNDIVNNEKQVQSQDSINTWDDGYPSGGNYWSDYIGVDVKSGPNQDQVGSDGIGDTPYVIDVDNRDHYPLWYPWSLPSAEHELAVFLETPTIIPPGSPSLLIATVVNKGLNNETSVGLLLMIDGSIVNSTIIPFLQVGSFYTIDHQWTSTIEGIYNITAYAPPVSDEEFTTNNIVIKLVAVFAGTRIYVSPLESTVVPRETFTVNINVAAVEDLYAWQVTLNFDPAVLDCTGAWLPSDHVFADRVFFTLRPIINNAAGYVKILATLLGDIPRFNGSGILCQIEFTATALGTSDLTPGRYGEDTVLLQYPGRPNDIIPDVTLIDGFVEVVPPSPDVNGDGVIDIFDVIIWADAFHSQPGYPNWNPYADLNQDEIIDIFDGVIIGVGYGKTYS